MDVRDEKKKEDWKNWCFWIVVLEKTLEGSLECKEIKPVNPKGNPTWIFIRRTDAKLKLKLQYFGHTMGRTDSLEKTLILGKIESKKRRGQQRMRWLERQHHWLNRHEFEIMKDREAWPTAALGVTKSRTWLSDWTQKQKCKPRSTKQRELYWILRGVLSLVWIQWIVKN